MRTKISILILIGLFFLDQSSFAQNPLKKGVYELSGSASISYSKNNLSFESSYIPDQTSKDINVYISPSAGYFVTDNLLIGGSLLFYYDEYSYSDNLQVQRDIILRSYGIGPNIRYYFSSSEFIPFFGAGYSYSENLGGQKMHAHNFTFSTGFNIFLSNSVALEPYVEYSIRTLNNPEQHTYTIALGLRIAYFVIN